MRARNARIAAETERERSKSLAPGESILDLAGANRSRIRVFGIDASAKLIAAFRERFPSVQAECAAVEDSEIFGRCFDAIIAWGLMFLLPAEMQEFVIGKARER